MPVACRLNRPGPASLVCCSWVKSSALWKTDPEWLPVCFRIQSYCLYRQLMMLSLMRVAEKAVYAFDQMAVVNVNVDVLVIVTGITLPAVLSSLSEPKMTALHGPLCNRCPPASLGFKIEGVYPCRYCLYANHAVYPDDKLMER